MSTKAQLTSPYAAMNWNECAKLTALVPDSTRDQLHHLFPRKGTINLIIQNLIVALTDELERRNITEYGPAADAALVDIITRMRANTGSQS